ncbi:ATP-dependent Clp protease adapter protein CLPS2, chloroplastic-like [Typha angustifolia]|uniref:ATP-dependent Clp protease adapter protein CLPS2, chloroplastic-like n=1 Tax=Typha angustifolia TaxID=59011 RepID=UPI003C2DC814
MAISSRAATYSVLRFTNSLPPSPTPFSSVSMPSKKSSTRPEKTQHREMVFLASAVGRFGSLRGGGALLERPTFDQTQFDALPLLEEGGDIGRLSDKKGLGSGDSFKVLLIDDPRHTEKLVEKALPQVVPSVTVDEARKLFYESRDKGVAVVIVTVKEHAEFYAQMMVRQGLRSAIEPDSNSV